jgi:hypothetical protein
LGKREGRARHEQPDNSADHSNRNFLQQISLLSSLPPAVEL